MTTRDLGGVPARGHRYAVQPTHCVKGCGRALAPSYLTSKRYVCKACYGLRRGRQPLHRGPCVAGCGARGQGRSGLCKRCWRVVWGRRHRRTKLLERVLGEALPLEWCARCLDDSRAKDYVRRFIAAILNGHISLGDGQAMAGGPRRRHARAVA